MMKNRIFSMESAKAAKAQNYGYLNAIHYMAPASLSGFNLCPKSTPACRALCLGWESGQASMVAHDDVINSVRQSRIDKARRFMRDRKVYMQDVVKSIELAEKRAAKLGFKLCVRMNGSTDIAWEGIACARDGVMYRNVMLAFPHLQFVDYTKIAARLDRDLPSNYCLVLSRTEDNDEDVRRLVRAGGTAAAVFAGELPAAFNGLKVISGDDHDLLHLNPRGVILGLTPKGRKAKRDRASGFVILESDPRRAAA